MVEKRTPVPVKEAIERVMENIEEGEVEEVSIQESYGRRLAETITAAHPVPPFDRSPYDGFAIRSTDSRGASREQPVTFQVVEEIGAGFVSKKELGPFQAVRIMTGAKIPEQCDAVVMLELAQEDHDGTYPLMTIKREFEQHQNISFEGEDTEAGAELVPAGTWIDPGVTALLATFGYATVKVAKKPVVGVFATGTELLDVSDDLEPGKIRNSNAYMMIAQLQRAGAEPVYYGKLKDELDPCYEAVRQAAEETDMVITTGGVSVGDYDLLPDVYERLGADVFFNKVAMRPGSVTTVASWEGTLLFGLSGNPSACYMGFELFVRPVIQAVMHSAHPHHTMVKAELAADFSKPNPFTRFVRGSCSAEGDRLFAEPGGFNKSSAVTSLAGANACIVLPGGSRGYQQGDVVDVMLLEDNEGQKEPLS